MGFKLFSNKDDELIEKELEKYNVVGENKVENQNTAKVAQPVVNQTKANENTIVLNELNSLNHSTINSDKTQEYHLPNSTNSIYDEFDKIFADNQLNEIEKEKENQNDEEYEYVEPHYTAKAVLVGVIAVLIGVVAGFFIFRGSIEATMRQAYIEQGYIKTNDSTATEQDIRLGKTAYVNGKLVEGKYVDIDTSKATAKPEDILKGYTAYVDGQLITGTIPTYKGSTTITPSTKNVTIPAGYYIEAPISIVGDQNLTPANIKENVVIFGIKGIYKGQ